MYRFGIMDRMGAMGRANARADIFCFTYMEIQYAWHAEHSVYWRFGATCRAADGSQCRDASRTRTKRQGIATAQRRVVRTTCRVCVVMVLC